MTINEIFCSLQGEGYFTGVPAVFIRTSGCNLACDFCDTKHQDGCEMSVEEIISKVSSFTPRHVIITGGEPAIQRDLAQLVEALHAKGFFVQIETNGTRPLPDSIDWVTCSPKILDKTVVLNPHELKVVYEGQDLDIYEQMFHPQVWSLQPCDRGNATLNQRLLNQAIEVVLSRPQWRLSLQTHKLIGIK